MYCFLNIKPIEINESTRLDIDFRISGEFYQRNWE